MNTVVAQRPAEKPIDLIRTQLYLPSMQDQLKSALPPHVTVEKFLRVAMTALQQNPNLLNMDRGSLFASVVTAAQLGLLPDAQLGEAYFVPFKGKVTLVPGYRGLIKLARQGDIGFVEAEIVCLNDKTLYVLGDNSHFESMVNWQDRGPMVMVYALAKYRDGGIAARVVMTKAQVDAIRGRSQNANGPAWSDNYEEMAKKTALRRLAKLLPLSTTANNAFRLSELHEEMSKGGRVIEGHVIEDEDEPRAAPAPAPEPKARRRRTALDGIGGTEPAARPTEPVQASGGDDGTFSVDPDTGEVVPGDLFDGPQA
jgi:recombination protein RecT